MGIFNPNIAGNAATADLLRTSRLIGGVSFNGGADINLPGVNAAGNQNTSGNAATATNATNAATAAACTGNSATATNLSTTQNNWATNGTIGTINAVVGLLAWKNYGNQHVIFDASASTSPNGSSVNPTNPQNAWNSTFPTLMGWNGSQTYGVRVDSARKADSADSATTATNVSGGTATVTSGTVTGNLQGFQQGWNVNGDITANRGNGTGVIYLGASNRYLFFDGTKYNLEGAQLFIAGIQAVTNNGGTWGINITGNAGSVGGQSLAALDSRYSADRVQSSASAIGAYAFLAYLVAGSISPGTTVAGSSLQYSDTSLNSGSNPPGTWRLHGYIGGLTNCSVWQRVA